MCPAPWQPALGFPGSLGEVYLLPSAIDIWPPLTAKSRHGKSRGVGNSAGCESDRELWATQSPHLFCISEFIACKAAAEEPSHKTLFHKHWSGLTPSQVLKSGLQRLLVCMFSMFVFFLFLVNISQTHEEQNCLRCVVWLTAGAASVTVLYFSIMAFSRLLLEFV